MKINLYRIVASLLVCPYSIFYIDKKTLEIIDAYDYEKYVDNKEDFVPIYGIKDDMYVEIIKEFYNTLDRKKYWYTMERILNLKEYKSPYDSEIYDTINDIEIKYSDLGEEYNKNREYNLAFTYFLIKNELEDEWIEFRDNKLLELAKEICEKNNIDYYVDKKNVVSDECVEKESLKIYDKVRTAFFKKQHYDYILSIIEKAKKQD